MPLRERAQHGSRRLNTTPSDSLFLGVRRSRSAGPTGRDISRLGRSAPQAQDPAIPKSPLEAPRGRDSLSSGVCERCPKSRSWPPSAPFARLCPDRRTRLKFVIGDCRPTPREQSGPDSIPSRPGPDMSRPVGVPGPGALADSNPVPTSRPVACPVSTFPVPIPSQSHPVPCNSIPSRFVSRPAALPDDVRTGRCQGRIRRDFLGETTCPVPVLVQSPAVQSPKSGLRASDLRPWTLDSIESVPSRSRVPSQSSPSPARFGWERVGVRAVFFGHFSVKQRVPSRLD